MKEYMTIVIEYEGNPPIKNFHNPIPGMNVVKIAVGDSIDELQSLEEEIEEEKIANEIVDRPW